MQDNRTLATELIERFSASDIPGVLALMTDDVTWRVPGKPELMPSAGLYDKPRLSRLFQRALERLETRMTMKLVSVIADGDMLAVEAESTWDLKNGRKYRQQYVFLIGCRAGKIASVREYLDTQHAHEVWYQPRGTDTPASQQSVGGGSGDM